MAHPHAHPHTTSRLPRRIGLAASGWIALAATALPAGSPLRWVPVLAFVCLGPGLALLLPQPGRLRPGARLEALALAAPVSLSLATLVSTALFLMERFSTVAFLVVLALFATVAAVLPGVPLPAATRGGVERAASPLTARFRVKRRTGGGR